MATETEEPKFIRVKALAHRWNISLGSAYELCRKEVPSIKIRGAVLVPLAAVREIEEKAMRTAD